MKKIVLTFIVFAFAANVLAQLEVNSSGQVGVGKTPQYPLDVVGDTYVDGSILLGSTFNFLGTTGNVPLTLKVNSSLAGFTGSSENDNVSFGYGALNNPLAGSSNVAVGHGALYINTGSWNTASGAYALYSNTGSANTAIGNMALYANTTGLSNTANGLEALSSNTTGNNNTANGVEALSYNLTGYNNTAIGCFANVNSSNLNNATAIGYNALATTSNQVVIGNTSVTSILGYNSLTIVSDGRTKKNIRAEVPGLAFINRLQPVMYNLDLDVVDELLKSDDPKINNRRDSLRMARSPEEKEIEAKARAHKEQQVYSGFIAQDVENAAHSVGYDFSGVDAPENGKGPYGLRYAEFVVPLVKAVQELSEQNDRLQEQVNELTGLVNQLLEKEGNPMLRSGNSDASITGLPELPDSGASLQQNIPNPFDQSTIIRYTLPQTCKSAQIVITNTAGRVFRQIPLSETGGMGSITIAGGSLTAGTYLYTLMADGKEVDTKRMILTK